MKARLTLLAIALAAALPAAVAATQATPETAAPAKPHIAVVNGQKVSVEEFERAFAVVVRQKFYHRAPPEGEVEVVRREVADSLVDRALTLAEAEKRGLPVDKDAIQQVIDGYEKQYGASPNWKATRERALPQIERELREKQLLAALEAQVRDIPDPDEAAARRFYEANPALFTEPERIHLSVILLRVDPSSPKAVRDKAREEGRAIHERLAKGADFAELARIHSSDASAAKGGDLGYVHRGMLSDGLHEHIDGMKAGDFSQSLDVLDGVALFKLHERSAAKLREFADVRARATELLKRDLAQAAWKDFIAGLRRNASIETDPRLYPAVAAKAGDADGEKAAPSAPASEPGEKEKSWPATDKPRGP